MLITGEGWEKYAEYDDDGKLIGLKSNAPKKAFRKCVHELCVDFDWRDSELNNFESLEDEPPNDGTAEIFRSCQTKLSDFIDLLKRLNADPDILEKYIHKYEERQKNLLKYENKCK